MDPNASRETLDHSIMYIFAVALEDGAWHHIKSYTPARAKRKSTVSLWHKISTREDPKWTKKYHERDPNKKCFGGKVIIKMKDGTKITDEINVADAHPAGDRPFKREQYIKKFRTLTDGLISSSESKRFLENVQKLKRINSGDLKKLNLQVVSKANRKSKKPLKTIF